MYSPVGVTLMSRARRKWRRPRWPAATGPTGSSDGESRIWVRVASGSGSVHPVRQCDQRTKRDRDDASGPGTIRPMSDWNFGDVWGLIAELFPDRPAVSQGSTHLTWAEFDARAGNLSRWLLALGIDRQAKVAQYLYNSPAYLESVFACFKAGLVPTNTNYRYTDDELAYLWENSDAEVVVFHASFAERVERVINRLPGVTNWLCVAEDGFECPSWAVPYHAVVEGSDAPKPQERAVEERSRRGDDMLFIYTGGTTGAPKGVMWRQDDLFAVLNRTGAVRYPENGSLPDVRAQLEKPAQHPPPRLLPGPPLMHGTGLFVAMSVLSSAGSVVMPQGRSFDPIELLDLVQSEQVTELCIVGDSFARPLAAALDAEPDRWDLSSLWMIVSSGVMWSAEVKGALLKHNPKLLLVDTLGSSEAIGIARSTSKGGATSGTAQFVLGNDTKVLADDGHEIQPGSDERGRLALRGRGPVGYYKDEEKSASTFVEIEGQRWTIPGDFAQVRSDGSLQLLGRGSVCINTGGEKVFPEEVEEVLKLFPGVTDAVVVGVPNERFGEAVTAVVEPASGATIDTPALIEWAKGRLASYKAPRTIVLVDSIGRSPAGKVDYNRLRAAAVAVAASE
jgi:acyl-CoA synthetase (AMP-forming)/AMP-acid ligase II